MFNKPKSPQTSTTSQSDAPSRSNESPSRKEDSKAAGTPNVRTDVARRRLAERSMLSKQLEFDGNLKFTGTATVDCVFRGNIDSDDTLIVGTNGKIEGEIHAGVVEIAGMVTGNIWAKSSVKILAGSEVTGDIETPTISMEEGVSFAGRCTRPPKKEGEAKGKKERNRPTPEKSVEPEEEPSAGLEPVGAGTGSSSREDTDSST